jgi:hypothetical protein
MPADAENDSPGQKNGPGVDLVRACAGLLSLIRRRPHQQHLQTQVLRPLGIVALVEAEVFERPLESLIFVPHAHPGRPAVFINLDRRDHPSRVLV